MNYNHTPNTLTIHLSHKRKETSECIYLYLRNRSFCPILSSKSPFPSYSTYHPKKIPKYNSKNPQTIALHFPPLRRTLNFFPIPGTNWRSSPLSAPNKSVLLTPKLGIGVESKFLPPCGAARLLKLVPSFWPNAGGGGSEAKRSSPFSSVVGVCW